jgi:hypothetical protein
MLNTISTKSKRPAGFQNIGNKETKESRFTGKIFLEELTGTR